MKSWFNRFRTDFICRVPYSQCLLQDIVTREPAFAEKLVKEHPKGKARFFHRTWQEK